MGFRKGSPCSRSWKGKGHGPKRRRVLVGTLQGINISHLGKRKIIFKIPFLGDMLVPW